MMHFKNLYYYYYYYYLHVLTLSTRINIKRMQSFESQSVKPNSSIFWIEFVQFLLPLGLCIAISL